MIKPENIIRVDLWGNHKRKGRVRCERCQAEFEVLVLTARTNPLCCDCKRMEQKKKNAVKWQKKLDQMYSKGYSDGYQTAIKSVSKLKGV